LGTQAEEGGGSFEPAGDDSPRADRQWQRPAPRRDGPPQRYGSGPRGRPDRPWERDRRPPDRQPYRAAGPDAPPLEPLGEDEELVAGRRPVEEAFVAGRQAHRLLVVPQRRHALEQLVLHATRLRIPIVEVEGGSLTGLAGFDGHQGIALVVAPRRFATIDDVLARSMERDEPPFVLVLDSLEDPQNLGTLLRSAEAAGVHGVLFPTRRQAPLTPSAIKASAGAVEHLLLCPVEDLAGALADLHARGLRVAGAEEDAPLTARQTDLRGPLAIVVGSEGQGLGPSVRRRCDTFMRIPMRGAIGSLNAAVAGSVLLFEAVAQRDPDGAGAPPRSESTGARPALPPVRDDDEPVEDEAGEATQAPKPDVAAAEPSSRPPVEDAAATEPSPEAQPVEDGHARATTPKTRRPRTPKPPPGEQIAPVAVTDEDLAVVEEQAVVAEARARKPRLRRPKAAAPTDAAPEPSAETSGESASTESDPDDLLPGGPPPDAPVEPAPRTRRRTTPRA
jgi:23S rRNA (guanosine2251-2'-O)-methyltransferase